MNSSLTAVEKRKYENVWKNPEYRIISHSRNLWWGHRDFFPIEFKSALDIACGLGYLFDEWNTDGIDAWAVDITRSCLAENVNSKWGHKFKEECLWKMQWDRRFNFGVCADVMEHIPVERVQLTLEKIHSCCDEVLFKIAHFMGNDLGGPRLHLTLRPVAWWVHQMEFVGGTAKQLKFESRPGLPDSVVQWKI